VSLLKVGRGGEYQAPFSALHAHSARSAGASCTSHIDHSERRNLPPDADLNSARVSVPSMHGLLGEHIGQQRRVEVARVPERVLGAEHECVPAVALAVTGIGVGEQRNRKLA
jgi:hypothetical protein